jgi:2-methylcitrate dehydratase PrpD
MTISKDLAHFAHGMSLADVPKSVHHKAKLLVLDTLGICISSAQLPFGHDILAMAQEWEQPGGAGLIGSDMKVAPHHAAFVNGVLGHGQDYDDTHTESVVHPSGALVPAMMACAERDGVDGARALLALILASEASIRLALPALNAFHLRGFHTTSVACTFGSALLSDLTRGAPQERTVEALGICGSFASGLLECVPAASSAKRLHAGWSGLCGIMASDLARTGFTGPASVIEGRLGVYNSMIRGETYDLGRITKGMGQEWEMLDIRPKLYPCCHYLQSFIECASVLRTREGFKPEDVASISCEVAAGSVNMICTPWAIKIAPETGYDARFSLPYSIAVMLVKGRAGAAEFEESQLKDPDVARLMQKVDYAVNEEYSVKDMPGAMTIHMRDGRSFRHEVPRVGGDSQNPFSYDAIMAKFYDCTAALPRACADEIADVVMNLEKQRDLRALSRLVSGAAQMPT